MAIQLEHRLLTVEEYHRMSEAGILKPDDRVELLNGQLIKMSPIGTKHAACVERLGDLLKSSVAGKAMVRTQNPILLSTYSEPEPDIAIVRHKDNYYAEQHPQPSEVFLIIEVADSSLEKDRQAKLPLYAGAQIPTYWIVKLDDQEVEVYRKPVGDHYRTKAVFTAEDRIPLDQFDLSIKVQEFLP